MRKHNSQKVNELVWYQNDGRCAKRHGKRIKYLWSTTPERRHDELLDQLMARLQRVIRYSRKCPVLREKARQFEKVVKELMKLKLTRFGQKERDLCQEDINRIWDIKRDLFNQLRGCLILNWRGLDVYEAYKPMLEYRDDCEMLFNSEIPLLYVKEN